MQYGDSSPAVLPPELPGSLTWADGSTAAVRATVAPVPLEYHHGMACKRCGTVFCWDDADTGALGGNRKDYCSDTCAIKWNRARRRQAERRAQLDRCGRKRKREYSSRAAARRAAKAIWQRDKSHRQQPYECACGSWHLMTVRKTGQPS